MFTDRHLFTEFIECKDISAGVLWVASDDSRFVTGHELVIDAGWGVKITFRMQARSGINE